MPNRIIKESIWSSENLSKVSLLAQGFFLRLLPLPDDHGCFDARTAILRARLFPLNYADVSNDQIDEWLNELVRVDCIRVWTQDGVRYAYIPAWSKHQTIRSTHNRRTPEPPLQVITGASESVREQLKAVASNCTQARAVARQNPNLNPDPNPNLNLTSAPESDPKELKPAAREPANERTVFKQPREDFQKFWAPVEGYLRKQVIEDVFYRRYAGWKLIDMTHEYVALQVPQFTREDLARDGPQLEEHIRDLIESAGTGLLRERRVRLIPMET